MTSSNVRAGGDVKIAVVATRTIVGAAAVSDHSAAQHRNGPLVDWSPLCGLIAHASNALVNVVDPVTMQSVQGSVASVPSLISICVSVLQFAATVERSKKVPFHLNLHFNLQF